jgi:hypothetical protein
MNGIIKIVMVGLLVVCGLAPSAARAQTYNELFRQKRTQEKYLLKQLAYLQLYAGYVKKGYEVVGSGLNTIKGITSGEFGLHEAFFASLLLVNPLIKKDYRVFEIASMQVKIVRAFAGMLRVELDEANLDYVRSVRDGVMAECSKDLDELLLVVTASKVEMSDEQRLSRLEKVHAASLEKLEFVYGFYVEVQQLVEAKKSERDAIKGLRRLYEND